jgi:ankyrin repeat protein
MTVKRSDGYREIVELLLNNKADPNICCEGRSPLYIASLHGHTEIVELLLNNKADPNICCIGESPLYIASLQQQFDNLCVSMMRSDV